MTRKEALAELIEKVEAGFDPERRPSEFRALRDPDYAAWALKAYCGSLDAAKALHEAVLPGWGWSLHMDEVILAPPQYRGDDEWSCVLMPSEARCPARTWLLAILRALYAQEPDI